MNLPSIIEGLNLELHMRLIGETVDMIIAVSFSKQDKNDSLLNKTPVTHLHLRRLVNVLIKSNLNWCFKVSISEHILTLGFLEPRLTTPFVKDHRLQQIQ